MGLIRSGPRLAEPTEKRIVEVTPDGKIVSSEPLDAATEPAAPRQTVQPPQQVVRVKRGGSGALMLLSFVLVLALAGLGFYVYQTRDDTVGKKQAEMQLQQQRAVAEQKLQQLGRAADDLGDQVRDTQRDLGIPATPPPTAVTPSTAPARATVAPAQPSAPAQPQSLPQ
jgi:uncharacterized protein HemX